MLLSSRSDLSAHGGAKLLGVTIARDEGSELAIHAMAMRAKYRRLLPGGFKHGEEGIRKNGEWCPHHR